MLESPEAGGKAEHSGAGSRKSKPLASLVWAAAQAAPLGAAAAKSCPTLCDPIDSSPPGSAFPGILKARTLEWVAISFSNA